MDNKFKLFLIISPLIILFACTSTPSALREHYDNIAKADRGDLIALRFVADDYCTGVDGFKGNTPKTFIYPDTKKCLLWWGKYVDEALSKSDHGFKAIKDDVYLLFTAVHAAGMAAGIKEQVAHFDQLTDKIIDNYNPFLANAHFHGYSKYYASYDNSQQKKAALAKALCDNDAIACSVYASYAYDERNYQVSADYYAKGAKSSARLHPISFENYLYDYNLADFIINHPDYLPTSLTANSALSIKSLYFRLMQSNCHNNKKTSGYVGADACSTFKQRLKNKDKLLNEAKRETLFIKDKSLPLAIRQDKYKLAVTEHLKNKNYDEAVFYFEFLDRTNYQLPVNMLFYRGEAYFQSNKLKQAQKYYIEYAEKAGKAGTYYRKALLRLNEL